jgi:hypothetical protein
MTGAAETACVESRAAAPAANAQLRIAQNILNPLQPEWGLLPPNRTERKGERAIASVFLQMTDGSGGPIASGPRRTI